MEAGIVNAPLGTAWDQWDDDQPSERAIIVRAIREAPGLLRVALRSPRVFSWAAVVAILVRGRDTMLTDAGREVVEADPTPRQAVTTIRRLMAVIDDGERARIADSVRAGKCPTCGQEIPT